jgi:hypothetical protein
MLIDIARPAADCDGQVVFRDLNLLFGCGVALWRSEGLPDTLFALCFPHAMGSTNAGLSLHPRGVYALVLEMSGYSIPREP